MKALIGLLLICFLMISCKSEKKEKTIYIVRHAEKQLVQDPDPELAQVGYIRAKKLAQILKDQEIKHIFSTNYKRTQLTAQPTAEQAGVEIQSYEPSNHDELVDKLHELEGNVLVVGHSNTVSRLANYFIGEGEKFNDLTEDEYNFIYEVKLSKDGSAVLRKLYKDY
ncbi:MAG TPA: histidine phosphatase family protein [Algoriphagus sp.]|jgi:broad specificity phosphatase PhoE|uniref:SixA phosphatase family protein n=1 Tax=unclassified Algoriphagus TaxID=2641541 RepID=UPI000C6211E8|nr:MULTISPECIES: phosphoglycerate mutase family protein [unclassified Algoriphagus]MAL14410.1 histidine phosphatase family protein [Algoriphagus sp.]MAN87219.1 histidine phosphatase family protein [Algoriphagus sp.]QYH40957.1 histidine phosphatase family protein [Algoriphagus sp. NBT04N3]HAH38023.1 histidine phosphatase family protein [Algoriphagus sp.]HAS58327.1 histidine phosphatase family protein [Algoriphagus sp.]|tara:strand:+ start:288 stop:788 length:501 start_codon:yes stop_codon:yes gene_type:complete